MYRVWYIEPRLTNLQMHLKQFITMCEQYEILNEEVRGWYWKKALYSFQMA
jgi:hypothetical protein